MTDPLGKWRNSGTQGTQSAPKPYQAFGEAPGSQRLWLKRAPRDPDQALPYGYLTRVQTDTWGYISLAFATPFPGPVIVEIHGECLAPLIESIMQNSAAWIQVYDESWFVAPQDGQPIVHKIVVTDKRPEETPPAHQRH